MRVCERHGKERVESNLYKHLGTGGGPGELVGGAEDRHRLSVSRELQCQLLPHQLLNHLRVTGGGRREKDSSKISPHYAMSMHKSQSHTQSTSSCLVNTNRHTHIYKYSQTRTPLTHTERKREREKTIIWMVRRTVKVFLVNSHQNHQWTYMVLPVSFSPKK